MPDPSRPTIILATSNGTGMGHLARQTAIAMTLGERAHPVVFSMSQALPLVFELGVDGEYVPSSERGMLSPSVWQHYLADRIFALVEETEAKVFVFDGVWPYYGIVRARLRLPRVAFVWVRRPLWKPGANRNALETRHRFDLVLEPGDLASPADRGITADLDDMVRVPPVTLLEQVERLPREEAATRLGLDPDRPTALVTLRGDDPNGGAARAVRTVLDQGWQVAITRNVPGLGEVDGLVRLRYVFPLVRYLEAFDVGVVEAGYNSFHEMLLTGIPTVTVATTAAVTDDQGARSRWAAAEGLGLSAAEDDPEGIADAVSRILDPQIREAITIRCAELAPPTGASAAAERLLGLAGSFTRHRFPKEERAQMRRNEWRTARRRARRLAARARHPVAQSPFDDPTDDPLPEPPVELLDGVTMTDLAVTPPPEHLLAGTSDGYRRVRSRIATTYLGE